MALFLPNDETRFNPATLTWISSERMNVHVVPNYREGCDRPCGDGNLVVDLSRNANDGLREGKHVIFRSNTWKFGHGRVHPQNFL